MIKRFFLCGPSGTGKSELAGGYKLPYPPQRYPAAAHQLDRVARQLDVLKNAGGGVYDRSVFDHIAWDSVTQGYLGSAVLRDARRLVRPTDVFIVTPANPAFSLEYNPLTREQMFQYAKTDEQARRFIDRWRDALIESIPNPVVLDTFDTWQDEARAIIGPRW